MQESRSLFAVTGFTDQHKNQPRYHQTTGTTRLSPKLRRANSAP